ncbi:hypothetical protein HK096_004706 [Nowakowskiella sp. JEL0078]|nr:hypothetical protein HK096_004706 [Nowakowskiella sp. JEL0078]
MSASIPLNLNTDTITICKECDYPTQQTNVNKVVETTTEIANTDTFSFCKGCDPPAQSNIDKDQGAETNTNVISDTTTLCKGCNLPTQTNINKDQEDETTLTTTTTSYKLVDPLRPTKSASNIIENSSLLTIAEDQTTAFSYPPLLETSMNLDKSSNSDPFKKTSLIIDKSMGFENGDSITTPSVSMMMTKTTSNVSTTGGVVIVNFVYPSSTAFYSSWSSTPSLETTLGNSLGDSGVMKSNADIGSDFIVVGIGVIVVVCACIFATAVFGLMVVLKKLRVLQHSPVPEEDKI